MVRLTFAALMTLSLIASASQAQDLAARKVARVLHAQEKEVLHRVTQRIEFDKKLAGSTLKVEVQAGGAVLLSGSVMNEAAKQWAAELVENTTGVTSVIDEMAVAKSVRVIQAPPAVIETRTAVPVVEVSRPIIVPSESRIIVKP